MYATPATVSRCGMIWFSEEVMTAEMVYYNFLHRLRSVSVKPKEEELSGGAAQSGIPATSAGGGGDSDQDKVIAFCAGKLD